MDSSDLSREQLERLLEHAEHDLQYLASLRIRMRDRGFPVEDDLVQLVEQAHERLQRLRMWLHYRFDDRMKRPKTERQ